MAMNEDGTYDLDELRIWIERNLTTSYSTPLLAVLDEVKSLREWQKQALIDIYKLGQVSTSMWQLGHESGVRTAKRAAEIIEQSFTTIANDAREHGIDEAASKAEQWAIGAAHARNAIALLLKPELIREYTNSEAEVGDAAKPE